MTDTKKAADPETATAPLGRPYAETVSLEVVWAVAYVLTRWDDDCHARSAADSADEAVAALLATFPRGVR